MRTESVQTAYISVKNRTQESLRSSPLWWLGAAMLTALCLKVGILAAGAVPFNADEAVVALMARHILQGERPVFFYGQAYMGSLDAFLVAAGFAIFGEQVWVIRLVQALLYLGTLATTFALGKAVLGSGRAGVLAVWLVAVPTVTVALYTTVSLGGYGEMLLLGNLILLYALRIVTYLKASRLPPWHLWAAWGFLSGLGLWAFGLTLVYSLPAALFLAGYARKAGLIIPPERRRLPQELRRQETRKVRYALWVGWGGWAFLGFLAGSAPWWGYALANGPAALLAELGGEAVSQVDRSPYLLQVARHGFNLVVLGLPAVFGLRPSWEVRWLALPLLPFTLAFWLGMLGYSIRRLLPARRKRAMVSWIGTSSKPNSGISEKGAHIQIQPGLKSLPEAEKMETPARWLIAGVTITLAAGFLFTPFGVDPSGRYFLPLAVVLALFGAEAILRLRQDWGRPAYALVGLVLAFNAWGTLECVLQNPPGLTTQFDAQTRVDHRADPALIDFLLAKGERNGYTIYWVAYPLAFQSQEVLIFVPDLPYHQDLRHTSRDNRYPPYARRVAEAERAAYITTGQPLLEERLREGFFQLGVDWREEQIGDYRVFYGLTRHVRPGELDLSPEE